MRLIVALFSICGLLACSTACAARHGPARPEGSLSSDVDYLLTSAATDFTRTRGSAPVRVREVRSGYIITPEQGKKYRLCGSFSRARDGEKVEWTPFATIRTTGYEQYIGANAVTECTRSSIVWYREDLSAALQRRLDAIR